MVNPESTSLADEARMPEAAAQRTGAAHPGSGIRATRVRAARARFLPYVVAGAAVACGYLNVVDAGKDHLAAVFGAAVAAGITAGMAIGWLLLGLYQRRIERSATGRRRVDIAITVLTVPAYVAAGWTSALVGWAVAMASSRPTPEPGPPNAWPMLIAASLVLYPISYAFARRDTERPDDFVEAVLSSLGEVKENPRSNLVLGDFLIGLAWCIGSLFAIFGVLICVQILFASQLTALSIPPQLASLVLLVTWIGLTAAGTVSTVRWVSRRRHRRR